jgi:hypothetical protein
MRGRGRPKAGGVVVLAKEKYIYIYIMCYIVTSSNAWGGAPEGRGRGCSRKSKSGRDALSQGVSRCLLREVDVDLRTGV